MKSKKVLFIMVILIIPMGCLSNPSNNDKLPEIETSNVRVNGYYDDGWNWNLSIEITNIEGGEIKWKDLSIQIYEFFNEEPMYTFSDLKNLEQSQDNSPYIGFIGEDQNRMKAGDRVEIKGIQGLGGHDGGYELVMILRDVEWKDKIFDKELARLSISSVLLIFEPVGVSERTVSSMNVWDFHFTLTAIQPDLYTIPVDLVEVTGDSDSVLYKLTILPPDEHYNVSNEVLCYCQRETYDIGIKVEDNFIISSLTNDYNGGWIYFIDDEGVMGSIGLPQ